MGEVKPFAAKPKPHRIVVAPDGLSHGFSVWIEPIDDRSVPLFRSEVVGCPSYPLAMAKARLFRLEFGWPIVDECRSGNPPPRAA